MKVIFTFLKKPLFLQLKYMQNNKAFKYLYIFIKKMFRIRSFQGKNQHLNFFWNQISEICSEFVYINFFCKKCSVFNVKGVQFLMSDF